MCHHTCTPAIYLIALRVVQDSGHHAVLLPNADRLLCVQPSNLRLASPEQAAALLAQCTAARTRDPTDVRPLSTLYLSTYMHTSSLLSRLCVRGRSVSLALRCCECCTARCPTLSWRRCVLYAIALGNV